MKMTSSILAIAASTFVCALSFSPSWSRHDGLSLSVGKAEAQTRVYITRGYAARAPITPQPACLGTR